MNAIHCHVCREELLPSDLDPDFPRCPSCGEVITELATATAIADQFNACIPKSEELIIRGYDHLQRIGAGGMGEVWLGEFARLGQAPRYQGLVAPIRQRRSLFGEV
ncbi:MAG: hypothetical protein R3C10_23835 [Pirellulales bacterium]